MEIDPLQDLYQSVLAVQNAPPNEMRAKEEALQKRLQQPGSLLRLQTIVVTQSLDLTARSVLSLTQNDSMER